MLSEAKNLPWAGYGFFASLSMAFDMTFNGVL